MGKMTVPEKLAILADAAKYDASCASSGGAKRNSRGTDGIGSTGGAGICHSYAPDGRCISLLKVLLTNQCIFDCAYCINRESSNVQRARFTVDEVVNLTLDFYKRNYIEGLFLSSGIIRSPDYTMEQVVAVARKLRLEHGFNGYIHLKTIPEADPALLAEAGRHADRLSINIELPTQNALKALAPEKDAGAIDRSMGVMADRIAEAKYETKRSAKAPLFAPGGQSTQVIVGADESGDSDIIANANRLYGTHKLKRVYYSAFSPIPDASRKLPLAPPPLMREHRLYQADWLMRFYGFEAREVQSVTDERGMLDLALDPKLSWALANRAVFPVDVNAADREWLLRVPGFGVRSVDAIIAARRVKTLRLEDVARICRAIDKPRPFITAADWSPGGTIDASNLRERYMPRPKAQLDLFAA